MKRGLREVFIFIGSTVVALVPLLVLLNFVILIRQWGST